MKKVLLYILFCISPVFLFGQQEMLNSQYMFNNLSVNPAYAGYKEDININLLGRSQWSGIKGAPKTQSVLMDGAFTDSKNVGLGLAVINDKAGLQSQLSAYANYAYRLKLTENDSRLSFGVGFGFAQFTLNGNDAVIDNPADPNFSGTQTYVSPDARLGIYYNSEKYYAGFSATNLLLGVFNKDNAASQNVILPSVHLFFTAGAIFDAGEALKVKPSVMVRDDPQQLGNIDFNTSFLIKEVLWLGASYRMGVDVWKKTNQPAGRLQNNSLIGMMEVFLAKRLRLGYAYDYALSPLGNYTNGSHEISLGYTFGGGDKGKPVLTPRYF